MKKTYRFAAGFFFCACLLTSNAQAFTDINGVEVTANVGFVTEYSFRGIAQSNEEPTVQGGFDLNHESGLYAGVWGSGVDFEDASTEFDFYAGYSGDVDGFLYDLGAIYYAYPGSGSDLDYNFYEVSASLGYDFELFAVAGSVNYSPEFFADSGDAQYYALSASVPLPKDFTVDAHVGYQAVEDNDAYGVPDYYDWSLGMGYSWKGLDFSLAYIDTDLDEPTDCADGCDSRVIFGVTHTF